MKMKVSMRPSVHLYRSPQGNSVPDSLRTRGDTMCIAQQVTSAAPSCATTCIAGFIFDNYAQATCMETSSLNFLCTTKTDSGLTIGEGGLQCVVSDCGSTDYVRIYNVCNNVQGAQPRLASTITATVNAVPTSSPTSTSSSTSSSTQSISITQTPSPTNNAVSVGSTSPVTMSSVAYTTANGLFPAVATSTSTNAPVASSAPAGQTAGIAVGTVAGAFGLIGVIFFMCIRKKRRRQQTEWEDQQATARSESPSSSMFSVRRLSPAPAPVSGGMQMRESRLEPSLLTLSRGLVAASSTKEHRSSFAPGIYAAIAPIMGQRDSQLSSGDQQRRSFWRKSIRPEEIGVAVSPKEGVGFFRRSNPSSRRKTRSMMPIPESSVLPTVPSPADSEDETSTGFGTGDFGTGTGDSINAKARRDAQSSAGADSSLLRVKKQSRPFSFDRAGDNSDLEAQTEPHNSSIRGSLLSSTRASIANIGALLARKVSMKREHAPPRPLILGSPNAKLKAAQPSSKYPLTPNYDNGTFVVSPSAIPFDPPTGSSLSLTPPNKIPRKPTFSSFIRGTLLPASILKSPPSSKTQNSDGRARPPFSRQHTETYPSVEGSDAAGIPKIGDTISPDEDQRKSVQPSKSPGMLPAPLAIKKTSTHRSRKSSLSSPIKSLRYTRVPSSANLSSYAARSRSSKSPSSRSRPVEELSKDYTDRPLPPLASLLSFDPVRAAATSPSPVNQISDPTTRPLSPIDTSPRGKPGFPSMAPSLTSIYTSYKAPTVAAQQPMSTEFTAPAPLPLGEFSNTYTGNRTNADMFSPDSAISGRDSMTPKWVVTPNRTKTGDLVLMVGDHRL